MKFNLLMKCCLSVASAFLFSSVGFAVDHHQSDRFGSPWMEQSASRVIRLDEMSKYVNVTRGETVTLVKNGNSFTWNFDTLNVNSFQLSEISPQGFEAGEIRVYVAPNRQDTDG